MCEVFVDDEVYYPGQTVTGRVECHFSSEKIIRGIQIVFEGNGNVKFGIRNPIVRDEKYCKIQLVVAKNKGETDHCLPGRYKYAFSFYLPYKIPASITLDHGHISYCVTAIVHFDGENALSAKTKIEIGSEIDLNTYSLCKKPVCGAEFKNLFLMKRNPPAITFLVKLPQGGYVPSQTINFIAKVHNMSSVKVWAVRFKIVQVFKFLTEQYQHKQCKTLAKTENFPNSSTAPGTERSWKIQLQIPSNALVVDLTGCHIIKMHCEVVGTAVLPFPHRNLKIRIPFYLGTVPIKSAL